MKKNTSGRKVKVAYSKREWKFTRTGLLFASPWIIGFIIFTIFPVLLAFYYSFTDYNLFSDPTWVGLKNYNTMLHDKYIWKSITNTLYIVILAPLIGMVVSLALAMLLNQRKIFGLPFFRTIFYLPSLVPIVASVMLFSWVLNGNHGLMNEILGFFGIEGPSWLNDPRFTKISLMMMDAWRCGGTMIIYLAALRSVPATLYEAAELDGATGWKRFIKITVPYISPTIEFNVIMSMIGSFQYFTQGMIFSSLSVSVGAVGGGPGNSLLFYCLYLYKNAFTYFKMGYACAMAVILFVVVMVTTALARKVSDRLVNYDVE